MLLKATLNGIHASDHSGAPLTTDELAAEARAAVALGAGAIQLQLQPRDVGGNRTLDPTVVNEVIARVKQACGVPVGVSTGAQIEPDPKRRAALVSQWRAADFVSVNLSEAGAFEVMAACDLAGIAIEAGISSPEDAEALVASRYATRVRGICVELGELPAWRAQRDAVAIRATLDAGGVRAPRVQHGDGAPTVDNVVESFDSTLALAA